MESVYTVSQLTFEIKSLLEQNFTFVCVQGEISNFKLQSSGHLYFSLKDAESQISAVCFRGNASKLSKIPAAGDHVLAKGELSLYPPKGNYQLIVRELSFLGMGALLQKLQELKEKIKAKGWMDASKKKKLPKLPKTIGVVTSPTGAVIQDILNVLTRRFAGVRVLLYPVKVQGEGSAVEIAKAIGEFNQYGLADVLIVGRGGGTLEDLWAFNEEIVAEAIFHSKIPIISAVGHETDYTIADFVADVRAPTPSAAAELVIAEKAVFLQTLQKHKKQIFFQTTQKIHQEKLLLRKILNQKWFFSAEALLGKYFQELDDFRMEGDELIQSYLENKILKMSFVKKQLQSLNPQNSWAKLKQKLRIYQERMDVQWKTFLQGKRELFEKNFDRRLKEQLYQKFCIKKEKFLLLLAHLQGVDPKNLLKKGYSILFSEKDHSLILSAESLKRDQRILIVLQDGSVIAKVEEFKK